MCLDLQIRICMFKKGYTKIRLGLENTANSGAIQRRKIALCRTSNTEYIQSSYDNTHTWREKLKLEVQ